MATIYKRTKRKPIPDGAEIVRRKKRQYAVWIEGDRRRRAPLSANGAGIIMVSAGYVIQYFDHNGKRRKKSVRCGDLDTARQVAAELERKATQRREGLIDPAQERLAQHGKRPLAEHLADFARFLRDKGRTPKHVAMTTRHVERIAEKCCAESLAQLTGPVVMRAVGDLRDGGASLRTCNAYLASVKAITRWAWKHKRSADDALCGLEKYNVDTDRRWVRRALTAEESSRLVQAAAAGPAIQAVDGPTRAMLYIVAAWTGFRRKELASLTLRSFDLDGDPPTVTIGAAHAKGKRTDTVPLHPVVVERLRAWLATRDNIRPDEPVFPLQTRAGGLRRTAKMMMLDLAAARAAWLKDAPNDRERAERERSGLLTYLDESGLVADFHANRHTFISNLGRAGVSLTTAQKLARHSDPKLTANIYTHLGVSDRAAAVGALPAPPSTTAPSGQPQRQALLATGTDDARAEWGQKWGQLNGETVQTVASAGKSAQHQLPDAQDPKLLPIGKLAQVTLPSVSCA